MMEYFFFGSKLEIPEETKYLSVAMDGEITAHSDIPWYEPDYWEGYEIGGNLECGEYDGCVGRLEFGDVVCRSLFDRGPFEVINNGKY